MQSNIRAKIRYLPFKMFAKLKKIVNLVSNMGYRYIAFRILFELQRKSGYLKRKFVVHPPFQTYLTLQDFRNANPKFIFAGKSDLKIVRTPQEELRERFDNIANGKLLFFNSTLIDLGKDYDWITNPDTGYRYDVKRHWTEIADYSATAGDIKYVWEKSRFSYLYDIIRYDYHFDVDCSEIVFADILSWIKSNPINCGPNYRCSQEMSLRVLNWTFALHYYKDSPHLTDEIFSQMQFVIRWHSDHILKNINFSRIAVRNNHAITETLCLYLIGLLYPQLPGAAKMKALGKKWFEEEIAYQIYEDGTFLQFSMNYHRVVLQLLTWAIVLSEKNGEKFADVVYERARKSLYFLTTCMNDADGWLPNYGHNDGALFFRLSESHFRDYRPQLFALADALGIRVRDNQQNEDSLWYGMTKVHYKQENRTGTGAFSFLESGYYVIREQDSMTFMRCGSYKDRPHQADNLHLDIWYKGENILLDAGSYKYNTDEETMRYFFGTKSHNTVMLNDQDQMLKGGRFIWYYWTQCVAASLTEDDEKYVFTGTIKAFQHLGKNILHKRTITKMKKEAAWVVEDEIMNAPVGMEMKQLWHFPAHCAHYVKLKAFEVGTTKELQLFEGVGRQSSLYGVKEKTKENWFISDSGRKIQTCLVVIEGISG